MCTVGAVPFQAAAAAGKPYVWAIDGISDDASGMLFGQLLAVVNGCVAPEPTRRLTVPHVLESLTTLQRDVAAAAAPSAGAGGVVAGGAAASPVGVLPPSVPATSVYDVLAIVSAMEALSIDTAAVIDAIGGMSTSSLDTLRAAGVSFANGMAVKRALTATVGAASVTAVPARVGSC